MANTSTNDKYPTCPVCGAETDTVYVDRRTYDVVGCDACLRSEDAWDVLMAVVDKTE